MKATPLLAVLALLWSVSAMAEAPLVIAHRGASAERPEHTLMAYRLAIAQGADFIEPDLVITKDGHLVARHENEIGSTTDVAQHPEFADRKTSKSIDGERITGWFTEDFTLAELKRLKARERLPQLRPANMAFDGTECIPTFEQILDLVKAESSARGRKIGVYPETKHPSYFRALGLPLEEPLLKTLGAHGLDKHDSAVFIQSFEVGNLQQLHRKTAVRLVQLMSSTGGPADRPDLSYAAMATAGGLKAVAAYADAIGVEKTMVVPRTENGTLAAPTTLVADAHKAGLQVHVWTFRPENYFLPTDLRRGEGLAERGDAPAEIRAFLAAGIDGFFSDSVVDAVRAKTAPKAP